MLYNIGDLTKKPETELLVAVTRDNKIAGAVVYFIDMQYYGSWGAATKEKNAAVFRLLAVDPSTPGQGIGKLLTKERIRKAKQKDSHTLIEIHFLCYFQRYIRPVQKRRLIELHRDLEYIINQSKN